MDCQTALETLDCIRPKSDDEMDAIFADATAHAESCESCSALLKRTRQVDSEISQAMLAVEVPEDLKPRILSQFNETTITKEQTAVESQSGPSRRRILNHRRAWLSVVSAIVVITISVWVYFSPSNPQLSEEQVVYEGIPMDEDLIPFDKHAFQTRLPSGWANHASLVIAEVPWGVDVAGSNDHDIAGFKLDFFVTRRQPMRCHLLMMPKSQYNGEIASRTFSAAEVGYVKIRSTKYATVSWSEGDFVYVLLARGGNLETMQGRLETRAA